MDLNAKDTEKIHVLGKYIDSMTLNIHGVPRSGAFARLRAQKKPRKLANLGTIPGVHGGPLKLKPSGTGRYRYELRNTAFDIKMTDAVGVPNTMPRARLDFRARALHEHDLREIEVLTDTLANFYFESSFQVQVSSVDVAVDFQCRAWEVPAREDVITHLGCATYDNGPGRVTGMTFGSSKGAFQIVIYDKSHEIAAHHREWIKEAWVESEAYRDDRRVIRVELRFRRKLLRQLRNTDPQSGQTRGVDTISDLRSSLGDLTRYVLGGPKANPKFRVATSKTRNCRSDRRGPASWWMAIVDAFSEGMPTTGRVRVRDSRLTPDYSRTVNTTITGAVKTAALLSLQDPKQTNIPDRFLGEVFLKQLPAYLGNRGINSFDEAVDLEVAKLLRI